MLSFSIPKTFKVNYLTQISVSIPDDLIYDMENLGIVINIGIYDYWTGSLPRLPLERSVI